MGIIFEKPELQVISLPPPQKVMEYSIGDRVSYRIFVIITM